MRHNQAMAHQHDHARRCKKALDECKVCQLAMEVFRATPLQTLSEVLADVAAPKLRISLASVAVENLIDRTTHESVRGKRDSVAAMGLLKAYEEMGGGL